MRLRRPSCSLDISVKGVEGDFAALLFRGFTFRASFAYADGKYTDYPKGPCPLEWQQPNAAGGCQPFTAPANLAIKTSNPRGNPDVPGAYVLTGLPLAGLSKWAGSLGFDYELPIGHEVDIFARNLFDRNYITALTVQTGNSGLILGQPSDPKLVGITLRAHF